MLEDESGRIRLTGSSIVSKMLVTGCIISVMGSETADGDFEVIDVLFPGLPPQISELPQKKKKGNGGQKYVAIVSGLNISGKIHESFETHLLVEYLLGELTGVQVCKPLGHLDIPYVCLQTLIGSAICLNNYPPHSCRQQSFKFNTSHQSPRGQFCNE